MEARTNQPSLLIFAVGGAGIVLGAIIGAIVMIFLASGPTPMAGEPGGDGGGGPQGPPPASVRLGSAKSADVQNRFSVVGRLREVREATVAAEVEGKLLAVNVDQGDDVIGGQTELASIEDVWARLRVESAEARVASARAIANQSERDYNQLTRLAGVSSAQPKEVADAKAEFAADTASLKAAMAEFDRAKEELARVTVLAPFDGTVTEKMIEVGEWVEPGESIVRLISRGEIDAYLDVPERIINEVSVGEEIAVEIEPINQNVTGKVIAITPQASNAARTFPVKVRLKNEDGLLKAGMSVTARIPLTARSAQMTVPRDAVRFGPRGSSVWVAAPGDPMPSAVPVDIEVLFGEGDSFVVQAVPGPSAGLLHPDASVVVQGAEGIFFPGQPLIPVGFDGAPPEAQTPPSQSPDSQTVGHDAGDGVS